MTRQEGASRQSLPPPEDHAFFPQTEINQILRKHIIKRVGKKNLVWAMGYGSQVGGDAGKRSMHDVIVVVDDVKKFHNLGLLIHPYDYAQPHVAVWHAFLNKFGFNFYHSHFKDESGDHPLKLAVISKEDFIKGCSGTLEGQNGAFGMYVAGRIQKAALSPLYKREEDASDIETAINTARIQGAWFALGFLKDTFTYSGFLKTYVSLSYWADVRIEKSGKIETLIKNNQLDYYNMLQPILQSFIDHELITVVKEGFGWYKKARSLSTAETYSRLLKLKTINFLINYFKNPLTTTPQKALTYAVLKVARTIDSLSFVKEAKQGKKKKKLNF